MIFSSMFEMANGLYLKRCSVARRRRRYMLFTFSLLLRSSFTSHAFSPTCRSTANFRQHRDRVPSLASASQEQFVNQDQAALEIVDPETNCQVVLLGCLHGSSSSAANVERALCKEQADVVVLELCASRFADMRREIENTSRKSEPFHWMRLVSAIRKTAKKTGLASGVATAIIGGASGLQTALSGFEPGLEFKRALELSSNKVDCDIVLADQAVDETLRRFGSLPSVSFEMVVEFVNSRFSWKDTFGREAGALSSAVFGDDAYLPNQVKMSNFLTQDEAVQRDLIRMTLPPLLIVQIFFSISSALINILEGNGIVIAPINSLSLLMDGTLMFSATDMLTMMTDVVSDLMLSSVILFSGYATLALPATRIILCERDEQLSKGIQTACRMAAQKKSQNPETRGRVVAVLGLLHVNGVAKRLLGQKN